MCAQAQNNARSTRRSLHEQVADPVQHGRTQTADALARRARFKVAVHGMILSVFSLWAQRAQPRARPPVDRATGGSSPRLALHADGSERPPWASRSGAATTAPMVSPVERSITWVPIRSRAASSSELANAKGTGTSSLALSPGRLGWIAPLALDLVRLHGRAISEPIRGPGMVDGQERARAE